MAGNGGSRIRITFRVKTTPGQDGANKKKFSQIGPAVPEEIGHEQTNKQTNIVLLYKRDNIVLIYLILSPPHHSNSLPTVVKTSLN